MTTRHAADRPSGLLGPPSPRASTTYRLLIRVTRLVGHGLFGFRTEVRGLEHLPRDEHGSPTGGWIAAGLPHRTWVDPFVVADALPIEPRLVFFGDGRAIFRSRWRRFVFRRIDAIGRRPDRGRESVGRRTYTRPRCATPSPSSTWSVTPHSFGSPG